VCLAMLAWLAASNHCLLLGAFAAKEAHCAACHSAARHDMPDCCKALHAVSPGQTAFTPALFHFTPETFAIRVRIAQSADRPELDTGPPKVLLARMLRSLLFHAPPALA